MTRHILPSALVPQSPCVFLPVPTMDVVVVGSCIAGTVRRQRELRLGVDRSGPQILHQLFRRREPTIVSGLLTIAATNTLLYTAFTSSGIAVSNLAGWIGGSVLVAILASIAAYRISPWHPLAHIPGPLSHKLSSLRAALSSCRGDHFKTMRSLHAQYGPVVRMGECVLARSE